MLLEYFLFVILNNVMAFVNLHNFSLTFSLIILFLKGTAILVISIFYMKELFEPQILIPVSSKSVEKYGSYGRFNICK